MNERLFNKKITRTIKNRSFHQFCYSLYLSGKVFEKSHFKILFLSKNMLNEFFYWFYTIGLARLHLRPCHLKGSIHTKEILDNQNDLVYARLWWQAIFPHVFWKDWYPLRIRKFLYLRFIVSIHYIIRLSFLKFQKGLSLKF